VFVFRVDTESGGFVAADPPSVASAAGAGPRHAAFHPEQRWAYVVNELNSTITAYKFDASGDGFREFQTLSSLPEDVTRRSTGSEIVVHPSGRFVYVSNRGHNSVGVFGIQDDGSLRSIGWCPSGGDTPRAIVLDPSGRFLYAANQMSDTVVAFRVDERSGELTPTGQVVSTGSPSTIAFAVPQ
jgi:6-phosphogluconolactonase (cycloisomerase 2 family)